MIKIRRSDDRGHADHGWLKSKHTFSFADYHDPEHMAFRALRVINEDWIEPGQGFGTHGHRDMEIISYVVSGGLEHKDSMGTGSVINAGDVQYMSAGSGVTHSEFNHSNSEQVHLLQIWIFPNEKSASPRYAQVHCRADEKRGDWKLIVSPKGEAGSIAIRQDAQLYARILNAGEEASYSLSKDRFAWIQIVKGKLELGNEALTKGDGVSIEAESILKLKASETSEILLFDLP